MAKTFEEWYLGAATEIDRAVIKQVDGYTQLVVDFDPVEAWFTFWEVEFGRTNDENTKERITLGKARSLYSQVMARVQ